METSTSTTSIPTQIYVPGGGSVTYTNHMGSDSSIDAIARPHVPQGEPRSPEEIARLLNYMVRERHTSPFEFGQMVFFVQCPIFVARQWFRHRMGSFSEQSARYTVLDELYTPPVAHMRKSSPTRKQGSSDNLCLDADLVKDEFSEANCIAYAAYQNLLRKDLSRETARAVLPLATMTRFYWRVDLHNLMNFVRLRVAKDAQFQISEYANAVARMFEAAFPITYDAFRRHVLETVTVPRTEYERLLLREQVYQAGTVEK